MLRSAVATVCRGRGCLPQLLQGVDPGVATVIEHRSLHMTACMPALFKDRTTRKARDNTRPDQDVTSVPEEEGLNVDSMFPSLETHSMLINNTRFDHLPIIHIKATYNNTIVTVADSKGVILANASGGIAGFRNARKGTNIAAQAAALCLAQRVKEKGIELGHVRVSVKGIGPGRLPAIKGLQMSGMKIVSLTDATPLPHNGNRPKKQRRV